MILVLGGTTGGLGKELHQCLAGMFYETEVVMPVGRLQCELEGEASIANFFSKMDNSFNTPLHIVNAAGVSISSMIHKTDIADLNRTLRVNLASNLLILKHARPLFHKYTGTLTMISSITASTGPMGTACYSASKAGLNGLMAVASKEFAYLKTRVNLIELGYTQHGMISQVSDVAKIVCNIPLGRLGTAADVAEACAFFIRCKWVTGCNLKLNGGMD